VKSPVAKMTVVVVAVVLPAVSVAMALMRLAPGVSAAGRVQVA
jgi:hypothetical protein